MTEGVPPKWQRVTSIPGMLTFGTATVVIGKVLFDMPAKGENGDRHKFEKPWFQVEGMFLGMMLSLVVYEIHRLATKSKNKAEYTPLDINQSEPQQSEKHMKHWKYYFYVFAPAMCDFVATGLMNIGLLWIPASIWQMLRGSMVVFSAIFSVVFLKKKLYLYNWLGVLSVCIALFMVGYACIKGDSGHFDKKKEAIGIILVVAAQVIQASQIVIEEFLLKDIKVSPLLIVGLEGFWGFMVTTILCLPIVSVLPGSDGDGVHENTKDSFIMMGNSGALTGLVIAYVLAILGYNMFGMFVTFTFTAVIRTILEAMRTLCIWIVDLIIYYGISVYYGEKWSKWSYLEGAGFILLVLGLFIYNEVLHLPGLKYPVKKQKEVQEDKSLLDDDKNSD